MPPIAGPPSRRLSQRQVIAYLTPEAHRAVRDHALARRWTLKEALAKGVNAELAAMGLGSALTPEPERRFLRTQGVALPRDEAQKTPKRRGRQAIAGWFDRKETERLNAVASECGRSVQAIVESGLERLVSEGA